MCLNMDVHGIHNMTVKLFALLYVPGADYFIYIVLAVSNSLK